jgi:hypothetical protein
MKHLTKRRLSALTVTALMALAPWAPARAHTARPVPDWVCDIPWAKSTYQLKRLIKCSAHRWRVPGGANKALRVARCESGFDPKAKGGGNGGVYQQRLVYWPRRARHYGFKGWSVYNGRANVIVSIRMAHAGGWGPWSCA